MPTVPRRPDFSAHQPNARFDGYRNRVARLFRHGEEVGLLLVRVEPYAEVESGHLWWTRWSHSRDILWLRTLVDGRHSDSLGPEDAADEELRAWAEGRAEYYGEELRAEWLNDEESARLRRVEFGMDE